jgi:hypothetical protein
MRLTGAGQVTLDPTYSGVGTLKALLHNFDVDGDKPKPEHAEFLRSKVAPLLSGNKGHIWMQGSASRTGTHQHNLELSKRRVNAIAALLREYGVAEGQMQLDAVGDGMTFGHIREDEHDRAVALVVLPIFKPQPPPDRPVPKPPPVTDSFQIRMLGGLSVGAEIYGGEMLFFQIYDRKNNLSGFYIYTGRTWQVSALPTWLSGTMKGEWNSFTTSKPMQVIQFQGPARFTTAGAGNWTKNYLTMVGMPAGVSTVPATLSLQTGFTVGVGASTGMGILQLKPAEALPGDGGP